MRKGLTPILIALLVCLCALPLTGARDRSNVQLISGEVISLANYMAKGQRGPEAVEVGVFQVEQRDLPIAILDDESGQIYFPVGKNMTSPNAKLLPLMGMMVNAQGPVFRRHGVNMIELNIVAEQ